MKGDKVLTVLGWFVLGTLILAIARQLSEQKYLPTHHGASYNRPRWNRKLLEFFSNPEKREQLTAKSCYEKDFMAKIQKTGNYLQRTNNYLHATPDNCSAPLTEFVGTFY